MLSPVLLYTLSGALVAAGLLFLVVLLRSSPTPWPQGAVAWIGLVLSAGVVLGGIGLGGLVYLNQTGYDLGGSGRSIGHAAPELEFRLLENNEPHALSQYRGRVVLLNLWATWCAPCLEEIPELNRFQAAYADRGVTVVTISDESPEVLQDFDQEYPLKTVNGYLPSGAAWPWPYERVEGARPTTFIIDRDGIIRASWPGISDFEGFAAAVAPYL